MPARVGFLYSGSASSLGAQLNAFRAALPAGITVTPRLLNDDYTQFPAALRALLNTVDVLVAAGGTVSAVAAKNATAAQPAGSRTPVVFTAVTDPVGNGFRDPGTNLTGCAGMTTELDATRLRLLQKLPNIVRVGVLRDINRLNQAVQWASLQATADTNLVLHPGNVDGPGQIRQVIQNLLNIPVDALLVTADPLFNDHRAAVVKPGGHALSVPAIYQWREFVDSPNDGLMSYGPNLVELYSVAAGYVRRILNGEDPANIPLYYPTNFELVINSTTAEALKLRIPPSLRSLAYVTRKTGKKRAKKKVVLKKRKKRT